MPIDKGAYLGPRLRRLRRDLGLSQSDMAADLEISVSYVSLIESNQRPLTADLLLRLARTYKVDMADFAGDGGAEFAARLRTTLKDPLFADIDMPRLQADDVATNFPALTEAFLRLHTAYKEGQLAIAGQRPGLEGEDTPAARADPVGEVRRFLAARRNCFPALDDAGEALAQAIARAGDATAYLSERHRLRVRRVPADFMAGMVRRHDPHHSAIFLDETLDRASFAFQLALQIVYLELGATLDAQIEGAQFASENGRRLARRALANYAAAAIVMPYGDFLRAATKKRYDVEALARQFGASFEQAAHRLTTLQRPGEEGVPFFFIRVDAAGNVSKRLDGAGFPFAAHGGGCTLWSLHHVFRTPGRIATQWIELPDGERFFSIARTVAAGGGGFGLPRIERAVALGCAAEHADRLVYAQGQAVPEPTPIGLTCSLCQRDACPARAVPPIGRQILPDDYHRRRAPFGYADD